MNQNNRKKNGRNFQGEKKETEIKSRENFLKLENRNKWLMGKEAKNLIFYFIFIRIKL